MSKKEKKEVDIGLDISTSVTGLTILDRQGSLVDMIPISFKSTMSFWDKSDHSRKVLEDLSKVYDVKRVFVEENLQKYRPGLSSASTLMTLSKFNGILCYISREIFKVDPISISVNEARKTVGIKLVKGKDTKQQVIDHVSSLLNWDYPKREIIKGKNAGTVEPQKGVSDITDAYVIVKAGQILYS